MVCCRCKTRPPPVQIIADFGHLVQYIHREEFYIAVSILQDCPLTGFSGRALYGKISAAPFSSVNDREVSPWTGQLLLTVILAIIYLECGRGEA